MKKELINLEERIVINNNLVDRGEIIERNANYITKAEWEDPYDMRYFDFEGNEITQEKVMRLRRELIGESLQYDLLLRIKEERELRSLIDVFKKYTCKYKLDKNGRKIIKEDIILKNEDAIFRAYDIPLLICTNIENKKPKCLFDFLTLNQFNILEGVGGKNIIVSSLIRSKAKELKKILKEQGAKAQSSKRYVLRSFVEEYLD